jgi:trans-aconitate 2-methyltransferase
MSSPSPWNPRQYDRFKAERAQPFFDLVAMLRPAAAPRVVDLGCGTGELTAGLPERLGAAEVWGLDNSETMLAEARGRAAPGLRFAHADIARFDEPGAWDVVLSNAALQWVPDHAAVLARWVASLAPGGQLAVQVPANADHPTHRVAAELANEEPFRSAFIAGHPPPDAVAAHVLAPERYAALLFGLGLRDPRVRLQVYCHLLDGPEQAVEWVKGTTLTRFKAALPPELFDRFVDRYRERLLARLAADEGAAAGKPYLYPFKRILMWGQADTPVPYGVPPIEASGRVG